MLRSLALVLFSATIATGCGHTRATGSSGVSTRLDQLEAEEARRQQRLTALEQEIEQTQAQVKVAKAELHDHQCQAMNALVRAEVISFRSKCVQQQAQYEACRATKESATAQGCAAGLFLALVSMGTAGPATLAACAGGAFVGSTSTGRCGVPPDCTARFDNIEKKMTLRHRPDKIPNCTLDIRFRELGNANQNNGLSREQQRNQRRHRVRRRQQQQPAPRAWNK